MKGDDTWAEGLIRMQTDFVYFIPQGHKIRKGGGFVLRLPEQGGGVEGAHEPYAVLLHKGAVLLGHEKSVRIIRWEAMRPRQTTIFGCSSLNCSRSQGIQASLSVGSGSRFWGGRHLTMLAM